MARLLRGENPKIDKINDLVADASNPECMEQLLEMFNPMILSICKKWSLYFNDESHRLKPLDELLAEAKSWFMQYTIMNYIVDGPATYNKFIKDHIDQRVRYIYECQLNYYKRNIFPDPDKASNVDQNECNDMLEYVAFNYSSDHYSMEDEIMDEIDVDSRVKLAHKILSLLDNSNVFNEREKVIFTEILYNGVTHDKMGERLGISRARVSQILQKIKKKLYKQMEGDQAIWDLLADTEIDFEER